MLTTSHFVTGSANCVFGCGAIRARAQRHEATPIFVTRVACVATAARQHVIIAALKDRLLDQPRSWCRGQAAAVGGSAPAAVTRLRPRSAARGNAESLSLALCVSRQ